MDVPDDQQERDLALKEVKGEFLRQGFVLTTQRSKDRVVYLQCDRGGSARSRNPGRDVLGKRKCSTRRTGCPFSLVLRWSDGSWVRKMRNPDHNHEADEDLSAHPYARRLDERQRSLVQDLNRAIVPPRRQSTSSEDLSQKYLFRGKM